MDATLINKTTLSNSMLMPAGSDRIIKEESDSTRRGNGNTSQPMIGVVKSK